MVKLIVLSSLFYYFNLFYIAITNDAGSLYSSTLENYFNYIKWLREALIYFASLLINLFGYETINLPNHIKIINGVRVGIGYSCLGYGLFSVWSALLLSYPFKKISKWKYILAGFISIFILNILRIASVGVAYTKYGNLNIDHHLIFNIITYLIIFIMIRFFNAERKIIMYILGINAYHGDSSACLLKDGEVICASEEERFRRIKHWAGFPSMAIQFCLDDAKITLADIEYISISACPKNSC